MAFIRENLGSILLALALAALLTFVAVRLIRNRHRTCAGCRGACSGCSVQGECHRNKKS